jgi:hypothetical protein
MVYLLKAILVSVNAAGVAKGVLVRLVAKPEIELSSVFMRFRSGLKG